MMLTDKFYYTDISERIKSFLDSAKKEVRIAVAWFTDPYLFNVVKSILEKNVSVQVIISDSEHNRGKLQFAELIKLGGEVLVCQSNIGRFMHNKFCIIDNETVITGSYNWSNNAHNHYENIVVLQGDSATRPSNIYFKKILAHSVPFCDDAFQRGRDRSLDAEQDDALFSLQKEFHELVLSNMREALEIDSSIRTDRIYSQIEKYSAVGAARQLVSSKQGDYLQSGLLKLTRKNKQELTFEAAVLLPKFRQLFTEDIIDCATKKLKNAQIEASLPQMRK